MHCGRARYLSVAMDKHGRAGARPIGNCEPQLDDTHGPAVDKKQPQWEGARHLQGLRLSLAVDKKQPQWEGTRHLQGLRLSLTVDTKTATMEGGTAFEVPSAPCANCLFPGLFPRRDTEETGVLVRPGRGEPVCLKAGRKQHLGSPSGRWKAVPCDLCAASAACIDIPADLSHAATQRKGETLCAWSVA